MKDEKSRSSVISFLRTQNKNKNKLSEIQKKMLSDVNGLINIRDNQHEKYIKELDEYFTHNKKFVMGKKYKKLRSYLIMHIEDKDVQYLLSKHHISVPNKTDRKKRGKFIPVSYNEVLNIVLKNKSLGVDTIGAKIFNYIKTRNLEELIKKDVFRCLSTSEETIDKVICFTIKNNSVPIPSEEDMNLRLLYSNLSISEKLRVQRFGKFSLDNEIKSVVDFILKYKRLPGVKTEYEREILKIYNVYKTRIRKLLEDKHDFTFCFKRDLLNSRINRVINFIKENKRIPTNNKNEKTIRTYMTKFKNENNEDWKKVQKILDEYNLEFVKETMK